MLGRHAYCSGSAEDGHVSREPIFGFGAMPSPNGRFRIGAFLDFSGLSLPALNVGPQGDANVENPSYLLIFSNLASDWAVVAASGGK